MTEKPPQDFHALARQALDLWQEHLAQISADPSARAGLAQMMEPSRRLFAEWIEKAQTAQYGAAPTSSPGHDAGAPADSAYGAAPAAAASDDGALRLAQLALHVAELEQRVARLESARRRPAAETQKPARRRREPN